MKVLGLSLIMVSLLLTLSTAPASPAESNAKAQSLLERGVAMLKKGDLDEAEANLRRSTELNGTNAVALYYLGSVLMAERRFGEARDAFGKALSLNAEKPALGRKQWREAEDSTGLAEAFLGNFEAARKVYARAIAQDPAYPGFSYNLACVCAREGDRECALAMLRKAIDSDASSGLDPMLPDPSVDEDLKGLLGDPVFQAILISNVGPQPNDGPAGAMVRRGAALLASGEYAAAVLSEKNAIAKDPKNALAWFYLGGVMQKEHEKAMAAQAFEKALEYNLPPALPLTKQMVRFAAVVAATERMAEGDAKGATPLLLTAVKAAPFHPVAHYYLAEAYALQGMEDKAAVQLARAFELKENLTAVDKPLRDPASDKAFNAFKKDAEWKKLVASLKDK